MVETSRGRSSGSSCVSFGASSAAAFCASRRCWPAPAAAAGLLAAPPKGGGRVAIAASWLRAQHAWMPFRWGPGGSTMARSCSTVRHAPIAVVSCRSVSARPGW